MGATAYLSTLRDRDDNIAYLSPNDGNVLALNTVGPFTGEEAWTSRVWGLNVTGGGGTPPSRDGTYNIQQSLGGPSVGPGGGAPQCAWGHATSGTPDSDGDDIWDGTCLDVDLSSPAADTTGLLCRHTLTYNPTGGVFAAGHVKARIVIPSRGIWLRHLLDNLGPWGVLPIFGPGSLDPEVDGVPAAVIDHGSYDFEWEPGQDLELIAAYVAGDTLAGSSPSWGTKTVVFFTNDAIFPGYTGGGFGDSNRGYIGLEDDGTGRTYLTFSINGSGGYEWQQIDPTSFAGTAAVDALPDCTIGWTTSNSSSGVAPGLPGGGGDVEADFLPLAFAALKVELRSPRYRWVWDDLPPTYAPPRRIGQRSDGLTGGATRVVGGGNTVQRGLRGGPGAIL